MKKLKLKLNALNKQNLEEKQMDALRGGGMCNCSCYYANSGGSSINANMMANYDAAGEWGHYSSIDGCNQYGYDGGKVCCPECDESDHSGCFYDCK
jgi:natural product precursor